VHQKNRIKNAIIGKLSRISSSSELFTVDELVQKLEYPLCKGMEEV